MTRHELTVQLVSFLEENVRFMKTELRAKYWQEVEREFDLALWAARELVRVDKNIVYARNRNMAGLYERATPGQISEQAGRQRRAGMRKIGRAADKVRVAADMSPDEKDKERLSKEYARVQLQLVMMRRRAV